MARQPKFTKQQLIAALEKGEGNLTRAAVVLGVSPSTIYRAMERHGVTVQQSREVVTSADIPNLVA